ncbi:hypothetical protein SAMN02949497_2158 [Methylomagnum ishizawai]|uniref:Transmembrane protein (PGPGW) n=1 Tax=Methylomagnum ishizawai TaxID=1760988 RepID=A0A1Y6D1T7_9GAMM|nr:hypothetical protein [Methylomagnum ishizawai]SMF94823.1 hypothetical protein SAMN02949497_2158 [Methylomagnum ishizawai]
MNANTTNSPKKRRRKAQPGADIALAPTPTEPAAPGPHDDTPAPGSTLEVATDTAATDTATPPPEHNPEAAPVTAATQANDTHSAPEAAPATLPCLVKIAPETGDGDANDADVVDRVEHLAKDVAWVLIVAGVIGVVVPGVLGTPFLIAGAAALWPGNRKRLEKWRQGHSPKFARGGMKQINRFLDDLERRYPHDGSKR